MNKKLFNQILKFIVVGATAFLIDYLLMVFLTDLVHINYLISSVISFSVSVIYNYVMSVFWVFDMDKEKSKTTTFVLFIVLSIIGLLINTACMWLFVDFTNLLQYKLAKIVATFIVMIYNFVSRKLFLEKK